MDQSDHHALLAIGAVDGRYRGKTRALERITSEFGLIRYRVRVECEWFLFLSEHPGVTEFPPLADEDRARVLAIADTFSLEDALAVKSDEAITNHDVKAVEYHVKRKLAAHPCLAPLTEWVHFACTSEDINNTAYALMLDEAIRDVVLPDWDRLIDTLDGMATELADVAMLSRTHGQTASPTTLGKELKNVAARLQRQRTQLASIRILGKFNGAVGNYNAHVAAYPNVDWDDASRDFLARLGLEQNPWTTQIEPHDYMAELFHCIARFNQVLLDFDRDIWAYISIEYFGQRKVEGETGSSTMPHKVNPIDFENSEGNIGVANALLSHLAEKLTVSRWQRDLSDSTVLRTIGTALGHCIIAHQSTLKGISKLEVNRDVIARDLAQSWEVLAEAVQTIMRKHGLDAPYERLKAATRGRKITAAIYADILETLELPAAARAELEALSPDTYLGSAGKLARRPH